jgi:uncharacterized protein (TIGR00255 family)
VLLSMTAYGSSSFFYDQSQYLIELYSVNKKGVDFSVHLPCSSLWLEHELRKILSYKIKRGQVVLRLTSIHKSDQNLFNAPEFLKVGRSLRALEEQFDKKDRFSLDFILEQAQIMQKERFVERDDAFLEKIKNGLDGAFIDFDKMKQFEGKNICNDLSVVLKTLESALEFVIKASKGVSHQMDKKIRQRAQEHDVLESLDKDRFYAEIAYLCDKYDIHEECSRLSSHIQSIRAFLGGKGQIDARSTVFVLQEMMREANTLCSKSPLYEVKAQGMIIKGEIEKFREQVQNVE